MTDREKLIKWCKDQDIDLIGREITCDTCIDSDGACKYAFDPYNLDGDCLAFK